MIQNLRVPVAGKAKFFMPHTALYKLLTRAVISEAVSSANFTEWYNVDHVVDQIFQGARRVFAILVVLNNQERLILNFIQHDNYQHSDHKLPFKKETLESIFSDPAMATDFYEKQWEFCAPLLVRGVQHRALDIFTCLPFVEDIKIGEGGFGEVFRITLHEGHQDLSMVSSTKVKQISCFEYCSIGG
jgi:hypothetical protein